MRLKYLSLLLSCLFFPFLGVTAFGQDSRSSSQLIDDLLSDSDVCVSIGYVSKENVSKARKSILAELVELKEALATSLTRQQKLEQSLALAEVDSSGSAKMSENNSYLEMENQLIKDELKTLLEASNLSSSVIDQLTYLRTQVQACATEKQELTAKIESNDAEYSEVMKGVLEELKLNKSMVVSLEKELGTLLERVKTLQSNDKKFDDLGAAITLYKKTVQRLLNEKKCKAGTVDGLIGTQTIRAAIRYANASNFPQKPNLVYDEEFFNQLNSSNIECIVTATNSASDSKVSKKARILSDTRVCLFATLYGKWEVKETYKPYVNEAKRRGLTCGVKFKRANNSKDKFADVSDENICYWAITADGRWSSINGVDSIYAEEAKRRGLTCGVSR